MLLLSMQADGHFQLKVIMDLCEISLSLQAASDNLAE
jgi:hypothetical protein